MAVTNIPNVQNWTVIPQNGQSGYFDLMNTWLGQSTLVIASLQSAITAQNAANSEINALASQTESNAIIATALANYQGEHNTLTTYSKGQSSSVAGLYYTSKVDGNLNHAVTDANYWLPNPINDKATKAYVDSATDDFIGVPFPFPTTVVPTGFIEYNGATISRTAYAKLFARLDIYYGAGDGSTTFKLPDLRGEFIRGWDHSRGVDAQPGRGLGSYQTDAYGSHSHTGGTNTTGAHTHSQTIYNGGGVGTTSGSTLFASSGTEDKPSTGTINSAGAHSHTLTIDASGSTETRPRNIAMMYCAKY